MWLFGLCGTTALLVLEFKKKKSILSAGLVCAGWALWLDYRQDGGRVCIHTAISTRALTIHFPNL